jgi:hypothetical protein
MTSVHLGHYPLSLLHPGISAHHCAFEQMENETPGSPRSLGSPVHSGSNSPPSLDSSAEHLGLDSKPAVDTGAGGFAGADGTLRGRVSPGDPV